VGKKSHICVFVENFGSLQKIILIFAIFAVSYVDLLCMRDSSYEKKHGFMPFSAVKKVIHMCG